MPSVQVYNEPAAKHVHYGAMTCFSCRAFFRFDCLLIPFLYHFNRQAIYTKQDFEHLCLSSC